MVMPQNLRKFTLTSHITFSVGWLGAIAVFLALAITALTTVNKQVAQATYVAMEISTLYIIIPFCIASFITGLIQALGTKWGLFKYYWIIVKLFLTIVMTALLFLHLKPISYLSGVAMDMSSYKIEASHTLIDLIVKASAAVLGLIIITTISIYKPWGRVQRLKEINGNDEGIHRNRRIRMYLLFALGLVITFFIIMHLLNGGVRKH